DRRVRPGPTRKPRRPLSQRLPHARRRGATHPPAAARPGSRRMSAESMIRQLPALLVEPVVRRALAEDLGRAGDLTGQACIPEGARLRAVFAARQAGVLAGVACARLAALATDPAASLQVKVQDGDACE